MELKAFNLEKRISINEIRKKIKYELVKREHSFLLYRLYTQSFLYIKDYGSVVFINCDDNLKKDVINKIDENKSIENLPTETYEIIISDSIEVDFEKIQITELDIDLAHVIMLNLGQAVALTNYVNRTSKLHDQTLVYTKYLEETGMIKLKKKQMRKFIGKIMNLKNNIAENLFIFDSPDVAWTTKELTTLDYKLKDELDIINRYQGIKNSLDTIKENLDLFSDILNHKYSSMLEWIVIILIFIEIVEVLIQ